MTAAPSVVPLIVHEVLRTPGAPLDATTRAFMESRLGHDFRRVRVHAGEHAAASARAVGADAYTVGHHVAFGPGRYAATTAEGRRLLAHELVHVVQHDAAPATAGPFPAGRADDPLEAEADRRAAAALDGAAADAPDAPPAAGSHAVLRRQVGDALWSPLAFATTMDQQYPGWRDVLPDCPCTDAEARRDPATWDTGTAACADVFHPGAVTGYRSVKGYASVPGTSHGQQCCYDGAGRLITDGAGAGTPDLWSPATNFLNHQIYDVQTWVRLGAETYNRYWVPNRGAGCPAISASRPSSRCTPEYLGFGGYLGEDCIVRTTHAMP